jgi:hypothetical protein
VDTPWLDRRQRRAWMRLRGVLELLPALLDAQLRRDADTTEFEYYVVAMLSEAPHPHAAHDGTGPADQRHAAPALACGDPPGAARPGGSLPLSGGPPRTNVRLTKAGWAKVQGAAPGHAATVRHHIIDALSDEQIDQLAAISTAT